MAFKTILWAVDPFESTLREKAQIPDFLRTINAQSTVTVTPVYVVTPDLSASMVVEAEGPWFQDPTPDPLRALNEILASLPVPGLAAPQLIRSGGSSTAHEAIALSNFAIQVGADAILVTTSGRTGLSRLFSTSFAESLLDHSQVPVITLGPRNQAVPTIRRILFPTDFAAHAKDAFRSAVSLAQGLGASITLFHLIPHPVEPILQGGAYLLGGAWVPITPFFTHSTDRQNRHARLWARWAGNQGVATEVLIDALGDNIAEVIVGLVAKRDIQLVAMEHKHGPIASTLLGSIARQVIRGVACPVWMIRPAQSQATNAGSTVHRAA